MRLIKKVRIPFLTNKNRICTINEWARVHWGRKSKLKNEYKELIKTWFIGSEKLPDNLHFDWQPIYKDKRKRDAINTAPSIKVFEDCLTEVGSINDDDNTSHMIHSRIVDTTLNQHILELKLYERE